MAFQMEGSEPILSTLRALSETPESDFDDLPHHEALARAKLSTYTQQNRRDQTVQILQSFIDHLPPDSKHIIVKFIATSDQLYELAEHLKIAVLIPIKASGGNTPDVTASPLDAEMTIDEIAAETDTDESSTSKEQPILKDICLKRDGYRCVITRVWDKTAKNVPPAEHIGATELAHIMPFSMGKWDGEEEHEAKAQSWETLYTLFPGLRSTLGPTLVNSICNGMTMLAPYHHEFGSLRLALAPTEMENTYKIKTYGRFATWLSHWMPAPNEHGDRLVTLRQYTDHELPSRVLLDMHAVIAEILHASGQGEQIDEILHDWESTRCLSSDGTTDLERLLSVMRVY